MLQAMGGQQFATLSICEQTAMVQATATLSELQEEYLVQLAVAGNLLDPVEALETTNAAWDELLEGLVLSGEQFSARVQLCGLLGGGAYDPDFEEDDFSSTITNPLLPYVVGSNWTYHAETDEGLEVIFIEVLDETRDVDGVECRVVRDTVTLEGELIEDTWDYYAQHKDGSVWYFGEVSLSYEDGYIDNMEGSWLAGTDGAKPGVVMLATPKVGQAYRQEYSPSEAEDAAWILATNETVITRMGTYTGCVKTADVVPLEPDALESKFFARGVGFVFEINEADGSTLELVNFNKP